jgi:hypothetical protein
MELLSQRIAEVVEFIGQYRDSKDLEEQHAEDAARGSMSGLERKLASLHSVGSSHGLQRAST